VRIQKHYRPELVVSKGKEPDPILTDPYLDAKESKLVATNRHAMVVLPVETDKGERSRYLACSLLEAARKLGEDAVPAEIKDEEIVEYGVLWPTQQARSFPPWSTLVPTFRRGDPGTTTIHLNPKLLRAVAAAMDCETGVALTFKVGELEAPVRVEPIAVDPDELAVMMPLRQVADEDGVDPDQRCPVCKRLLAAGAACPEHGRAAKADDGSVGAAVARVKGALAETGTTMTAQVGDGRPVTVVPPLEWKRGGRTEDDLVAKGGGAEYCVGRRNDGGFDTYVMKPGAKRSARLGAAPSETIEAAKKLAEKHHLEQATDAFLKNRGAGGLVKGEFAGDAVARKKGGRRG
jgi:hypothetical protein